jgi:hypothetical protein
MTEIADPTYAEIRFVHNEVKIEIVTFIKTNGDEDCQKASEEFIGGFLEGSEAEWSQTEKICKKSINELYERVFNNEQIHATYIRIKEGWAWGYDSRIVFYGVPSSQAQGVCEEIAADIGERFNADVECVQGTVG